MDHMFDFLWILNIKIEVIYQLCGGFGLYVEIARFFGGYMTLITAEEMREAIQKNMREVEEKKKKLEPLIESFLNKCSKWVIHPQIDLGDLISGKGRNEIDLIVEILTSLGYVVNAVDKTRDQYTLTIPESQP